MKEKQRKEDGMNNITMEPEGLLLTGRAGIAMERAEAVGDRSENFRN